MTARLIGLLALLTLAGCASSPRIITNQDPTADLAGFRTFDFMTPLGTDRGGAQSLTSLHLVEAATAELEARGLRRSASEPELLINFFLSTREVINTRNSPSTNASMHWRRGRYGTWGGHSTIGLSTTQVTQSTEGTLAMDMVDAGRNQLVWEGAATKRVTSNTRDNLEETLRGAVADMLAEFP